VFLDDEYELVNQLDAERVREWSYGDVLFERAASRSRAGRAIGRGRTNCASGRLRVPGDEVNQGSGELGFDWPRAGRGVPPAGAGTDYRKYTDIDAERQSSRLSVPWVLR
jgi:hypothetical protein